MKLCEAKEGFSEQDENDPKTEARTKGATIVGHGERLPAVQKNNLTVLVV